MVHLGHSHCLSTRLLLTHQFSRDDSMSGYCHPALHWRQTGPSARRRHLASSYEQFVVTVVEKSHILDGVGRVVVISTAVRRIMSSGLVAVVVTGQATKPSSEVAVANDREGDHVVEDLRLVRPK